VAALDAGAACRGAEAGGSGGGISGSS